MTVSVGVNVDELSRTVRICIITGVGLILKCLQTLT